MIRFARNWKKFLKPFHTGDCLVNVLDRTLYSWHELRLMILAYIS